MSPESLAFEWIKKWSLILETGDASNVAASGLDGEIPRENPRLCLDSVLEILQQIPNDISDHHFQNLAAGPLEDLLVFHGKDYVNVVETIARRNPAFRLLLNGVWSSAIDKDVLQKLEKYRTDRW